MARPNVGSRAWNPSSAERSTTCAKHIAPRRHPAAVLDLFGQGAYTGARQHAREASGGDLVAAAGQTGARFEWDRC